jgi:hypothetical protein
VAESSAVPAAPDSHCPNGPQLLLEIEMEGPCPGTVARQCSGRTRQPASARTGMSEAAGWDLVAAGSMPASRAKRRSRCPWVERIQRRRPARVIGGLAVTSGPQMGEVHLNGVIAGFIEYIPDDTSLPTYSGTYNEKLNGVLLELTFDDDQERISQFPAAEPAGGHGRVNPATGHVRQGDAQRTG